MSDILVDKACIGQGVQVTGAHGEWERKVTIDAPLPTDGPNGRRPPASKDIP